MNADTINFTAATGISIAGLIDTGSIGTDSLTLDSSAGILQAVSSGITTDNLVATSSGDMDYQGANTITNLNALVNNGSNLTFNNSAPLTIDVINAIGGNVTLINSGAVDQVGAIGGIVATSLDITGNSGDIALNDARNDVDSITVLSSSAVGSNLFFSYTDADDLEVNNVSVANISTSPPDGAFLDITSGGDMSLNGNINTASPTAGNSGITLNAQNGGNIVYQTGTISTDTLNLQTDNNPTTVGAVGTAVNPIHTAANATSININHGSNGGSGPPNSGGDLYLLNNTGDLGVFSYITASPSILQIENSSGNIDLSGVTLIDSAGLTTDTLTATDIRLVANGALSLPAFLGTRPPATESGPGVASRLAATGDIYLEGQNLSIDESIDSVGDIMLVSSLGSLFIQNTAAVTSSAGNVELRSDAFNINGNVTAQNQVVVREFSAAGGLEINDSTPTNGFATLTTTDLGFLNGTNLGIVLGNDLAHNGAKTVQVLSGIDSSMINGPALTFDTTNNASGASVAIIGANIDFTADNENLIFTGNGNAFVQSSDTTSGGVSVDTGTGNLSSSVNQFVIITTGTAPEINQVLVNTNNSDITGDLVVSSGTQVGESVRFEGNNLTVAGDVIVTGIADSAEIDFTGDVDISSALSVLVSGGTDDNAFAKLVGGNVNIVANNTTVSGGQGNDAFAEIASSAGGTTTVDASSGIILLQAGTGVDADALITGGGGAGLVTLRYSSCPSCDNQLLSNPVGNGVGDVGVFAQTVSLNGVTSGSPSNNFDPVPELNTLLDNFTTQYVRPVADDEEEDEELLVCR